MLAYVVDINRIFGIYRPIIMHNPFNGELCVEHKAPESGGSLWAHHLRLSVGLENHRQPRCIVDNNDNMVQWLDVGMHNYSSGRIVE